MENYDEDYEDEDYECFEQPKKTQRTGFCALISEIKKRPDRKLF